MTAGSSSLTTILGKPRRFLPMLIFLSSRLTQMGLFHIRRAAGRCPEAANVDRRAETGRLLPVTVTAQEQHGAMCRRFAISSTARALPTRFLAAARFTIRMISPARFGKVIDDSASTYILSYYPDHNKWNGEFREIKVKVNRSGVEVRARKGYFAVADTASATERDALVKLGLTRFSGSAGNERSWILMCKRMGLKSPECAN